MAMIAGVFFAANGIDGSIPSRGVGLGQNIVERRGDMLDSVFIHQSFILGQLQLVHRDFSGRPEKAIKATISPYFFKVSHHPKIRPGVFILMGSFDYVDGPDLNDRGRRDLWPRYLIGGFVVGSQRGRDGQEILFEQDNDIPLIFQSPEAAFVTDRYLARQVLPEVEQDGDQSYEQLHLAIVPEYLEKYPDVTIQPGTTLFLGSGQRVVVPTDERDDWGQESRPRDLLGMKVTEATVNPAGKLLVTARRIQSLSLRYV